MHTDTDKSPADVQLTSDAREGRDSVRASLVRLDAMCARAGLDLEGVSAAIVERMRLLAVVTETVRDCERCADLAEQFFAHDDAVKPPEERWGAIERRTVVLASLFSDIGKTGPNHADVSGRRLIAEMFAVENVPDGGISVARFFQLYFATDAGDRASRFRALGLDPAMRMRDFWNLHSVWTLQILQGDGVPRRVVFAAAAHHLIENINPHELLAKDERTRGYFDADAPFDRTVKLVIVLDKYDAARRRGQRSHADAIAWLRQLVASHPRFAHDHELFGLIDSLAAMNPRL